MNKTMTVKDAELRLDQLKNGKIPPKEVPTLANSMYQKRVMRACTQTKA